MVEYWHSGSIFPFRMGIILNLKFLDKVLKRKDLSEVVALPSLYHPCTLKNLMTSQRSEVSGIFTCLMTKGCGEAGTLKLDCSRPLDHYWDFHGPISVLRSTWQACL